MTRAIYQCQIRWAQGGIYHKDYFDAGATTAYDDLGGDVIGISIRRGRQDPFGAASAGTCTLRLRDPDGKYAAGYASSVLVGGAADGLGNLLPMRTLRVRATHAATTYPMFYGFITRITADPDRKEATIEASDALMVLARNSTDNTLTIGPVSTDNHVRALAAMFADPTGMAMLTYGTTNALFALGSSTTINPGESALQHINELMAAELGHVLIAKDGTVTIYARHWHDVPPRNAAQSTLTNVQVKLLGSGVALDSIRNAAIVQHTGGVAQEISDAASIAAYGMAHWGTLTTDYLNSDADAIQMAAWIVATRKEPVPVGYAVDLDGDAGDTVTAAILGRDLHDRVSLDAIRVGAADYFIIGIQEDIADNRRHTCRWLLQRRRAQDVGALVGYSRVGQASVGYVV